MKSGALIIVGLLVSCVAYGAVDTSEPFVLLSTCYTNPVPEDNSQFGAAVAVSANFAVVGRPGANSGAGGCSIYRRTVRAAKWTLVTNIDIQVAGAGAGSVVALDGDTCVLGAPDCDAFSYANAGAVFVVERSTNGSWALSQTLYSSNAIPYGHFGDDVAVHGSMIAVGAADERSLQQQGVVYVYTKETNWCNCSTLISNGQFGTSVALDGSYLAVGAPQSGSVTGTVYVYTIQDSCSFSLLGSVQGDWYGSTYFGKDLAMDNGHLIVVGEAVRTGTIQTGNGAVYAYDVNEDGISFLHRIGNPAFLYSHASYNVHVAVDGNIACVASVVYTYANEQWQKKRAVLSADSNLNYGASVAVSRDSVWVGASETDVGSSTNVGRLYGFTLASGVKVEGANALEHFGVNIAMNGRFLAAGVPEMTVNGVVNAGTVMLYRKKAKSWLPVAELLPAANVPAGPMRYGSSVAFSDDALIVGSEGYMRSTGGGTQPFEIYECVHGVWGRVLSYDGGVQTASDVAIDGGLAAATTSGKVFVFERSEPGQWSAGIFPHDSSSCVAISGDVLILGAPSGSEMSAYKHVGNAWQLMTTSGGPSVKGRVDADNGRIVLLSGLDVHVYKISGTQVVYEAALQIPDDPATASYYSGNGKKISLTDHGRAIVVGNEGIEYDGVRGGGAHIFRLSDDPQIGWYHDARVFPIDDGYLSDQDLFGCACAGTGNRMAVAAWRDSLAPGIDVGSVTVFDAVPRRTPADFDSDGVTDIGCYYPDAGFWYVFQSGNEFFWTTQFGYAGTVPFVGDFDGDRKADFGCYDTSSSRWFCYCSTDGFWTDVLGVTSGKQFVADFDGDGFADRGVFDDSTATWFFKKSADGISQDVFGSVGGVAVVGDFDGDALSDYGTYKAVSGEWKIKRSRDGEWSTSFGYEDTVPITGDFDGDGIQDFGCYYAPSGAWYIYKSRDGFWVNNFGYAGTIPVTGDFDGDGIDDFGCYYPPIGAWYVYRSSEGFWVNRFGYEGTVPMN